MSGVLVCTFTWPTFVCLIISLSFPALLFSSSMRGSIIFASMYIGGGLAMRVVGFSVGSLVSVR